MYKLERQSGTNLIVCTQRKAPEHAVIADKPNVTNLKSFSQDELNPPTRARISLAAPGSAAARIRSRESHSLTLRDVGNLTIAAQFANRIGLPLNRHSIAHFGLLGLDDPEGFRALQHLLSLMRNWCWRKGESFAYIWVRENVERGPHAHILSHIPARVESTYARLQWRWMKKVCDGRYSRGAFFSRPIAGWRAFQRGETAVFERNQKTAINYVLKGADKEAQNLHGITAPKDGGRIIGKRCGTSQNIGRAAQTAAARRLSPRAP